MNQPKRTFFLTLVLALSAFLTLAAGRGFLPSQGHAAQDSARQVIVLRADGALTPAMLQYIERGLRTARDQNAEAIVLQLNTPGGSLDLMNKIVQAIRASQVPVVVYVAPRGAMAGSAGTLITLAGHAAAMAPETTIGAASPVGSGGEDLDLTMQAKEKNILKATVRSLASSRPPDAIALAERTIEEAAAASAGEALEVGLVDFTAVDVNDLLRQIDGFGVQMPTGERTLHTVGVATVPLDPTPIEIVLAALTNPNIVFLLLAVGVQAVLIELYTPGGWIAGFIGVVCLALSAYGMGILSVNWFGLIFLVIAFALFILDIKAPTHGALTAAGVGSLIAGALVLFNSPGVPSFQRVSVPLVVGVSVTIGAIFFTILLIALRWQHIPVRTGMESLVGRAGVVRSDLNPVGTIQLGGEQWTAETGPEEAPLPAGTRVEVFKVRGLRLLVRRAPEK